MDKKFLYALLISGGILLGWSQLFPAPPVVQKPSSEAAAGAKDADNRLEDGADGPTTKPAAAGLGQAAVATGDVQASDGADGSGYRARGAEKILTLTTAAADYAFSNWGGVLKQAWIKEDKYKTKKTPRGFEMLRGEDPDRRSLSLRFPGSKFDWPEDVAWVGTQVAPGKIQYVAETPEARVVKTFSAGASAYRVNLAVELTNKKTGTLKTAVAVEVFGEQDPKAKGEGMFSYATANPLTLLCYVDGDLTREKPESLREEPYSYDGDVRWVAADEKFFTVAVVAVPGTPEGEKRCKSKADSDLEGQVFLSTKTLRLDAGETVSLAYDIFAGPKHLDALQAVDPGGRIPF